MTFRHPDLLWALLVVPLVALLPIAAGWIRARIAQRFALERSTAGERGMVARLVVGNPGPWRAARAVLMVAALALTIVGLAGPQWGSRTRLLHRRGIDIVIALDFSKSMLARDVRPNRIERAKAEVLNFVEELGGDRVGMIAFAGETMEFPMTTDYSAIRIFMGDLGPYDMPVGGTAIARAMIAAKRVFERASTADVGDDSEARRSRVLIVMTDGEDTEGDPVAAARELEEAGIRVYTIGIGSRSGEPIPTYAPDGVTWTGYVRDDEGNQVLTALTESNEHELQQIAEITGGRYFAAGRGGVGIEQIRNEIRAMHQDEQRTRRVTVHEDRSMLVLLPAFLLFLLEALLPDAWVGGWRRRFAPPAARGVARSRRRTETDEEELAAEAAK